MSRPVDWWVLDLPGDPTPGEPSQVRVLARAVSVVADEASGAARDVRGLAGDDVVLGWLGLAGSVFRGALEEFPSQLGKLADSYGQCAVALTGFAGELELAQAQADRALVQGRAARGELDSVRAQLVAARGVAAAAEQAVVGLDRPAAAGAPPPDPAQVQAATRNAQAAAGRVSGLAGAVGDAQGRLDAATRLAHDAAQLRAQAGERAGRQLHDASDAGISPNSFWQNVSEVAGKVWDTTITIVKVAVTVLGIVALVVGGPLAWVVVGLSILILADALAKVATGKGSWLDVAFAALGCIPGTKGLTTLTALRTAAREGGLLGAAAHLAGAGKLAITGMTHALRDGAGRTFALIGDRMALAGSDAGSVSVGLLTLGAGRLGEVPAWLARVRAGTVWHRAEQARMGALDPAYRAEVQVQRPAGAALRSRLSHNRVDIYNDSSGEIISLKHTQLSDISFTTAKRYLDEAVTKYQSGTTISDVPSNGPLGPHGVDLRNQELRGRVYVQVPVQDTPIPQAILDYARSRVPRVRIRQVPGS